MTTPEINSVTPSYGANDDRVAIQIFGSGFDASPAVTIGNIICVDIVRPNSNQINCVVPAGMMPESYGITVTNTGGETVTLADAFRVIFPMPPALFSTEDKDTILTRMIAELTDWDIVEGSPMWAIFSSAAVEIARGYRRAEDIVRLFFPQYSRGGYLDLYGESIGLIRDVATVATGTVRFLGTNGTSIPIGTRVSTQVVYGQQNAAIFFETTAVVVVAGGVADVPIRSVLTGAANNLAIGQIVRISTAVAGLVSVSNLSATSGGTDDESDDDYRVRMLNFVQYPIAGGNAQDYITWALEVAGVGDATVVPLGRGAGTVDVYILDEDFEPADAGLISDVQDYIAPTPADEGGGKAPIGADVLVAAPSVVNIDVSVTVTARTGYTLGDVQQAVEDNLVAYIKSVHIGDDILYTYIANVIHDTEGVFNYSSLLVNAGTADITIDVDEKALADTITVS